jgi:hypothetical protein
LLPVDRLIVGCVDFDPRKIGKADVTDEPTD